MNTPIDFANAPDTFGLARHLPRKRKREREELETGRPVLFRERQSADLMVVSVLTYFDLEVRMSRTLALIVPAMAAFLFLSGCTIAVQAPPPQPNYVVKAKLGGKITTQVSGATDENTCSSTPGVQDLCVTGLRTALKTAIDKMMEDYSGAGEQKLTATFKVVEVGTMPAAVTALGAVAAVRLHMRWNFTVADSDGNQVVAIAEDTVGPKAISSKPAANDAFGALESAVLDRIAEAMNQGTGK